MSKSNKYRNGKKQKHHRHPQRRRNQGKSRPQQPRVGMSEVNKCRMVALWCHESQQQGRSYPFHFANFYCDAMQFAQAPLHIDDIVDVWDCATKTRSCPEARRLYPGELSEEDVYLLVVAEHVEIWKPETTKSVLTAAFLLVSKRLTQVNTEYFQASPSSGKSGSIFRDVQDEVEAGRGRSNE